MPFHDQVVEVFRTVFDDPELTVEDHMTSEHILAWDSVRHINLVFQIEQRFGIRFTTGELARLQCVGDLKQCVANKLQISLPS